MSLLIARWTNSPFQHYKKCTENSMKNINKHVRVWRVKIFHKYYSKKDTCTLTRISNFPNSLMVASKRAFTSSSFSRSPCTDRTYIKLYHFISHENDNFYLNKLNSLVIKAVVVTWASALISLHLATTLSSSSLFLPPKATLHPSLDNKRTVPLPIPELPPEHTKSHQLRFILIWPFHQNQVTRP